MNETLITAGQFAKIASTTKRTIDWYTKSGLLTPVSITETGYRMYTQEQVIDFQVILLLRQLNFSIEQIKDFLSKNASLKDLFHEKRTDVIEEIEKLTKRLDTLDTYYKNFEQEGVFVKPVVKNVKAFDIYYIQKEGPYAKIWDYGLELKSYFTTLPKNVEFIAVYEEKEYKPLRSRFKVGVVITKGITVKKEAESIVRKTSIPTFKAVSYQHTGAPSLLSFHWKQLEKYADLHKMKQDYSHPFTDMEIYKRSGYIHSIHDDEVVTEMLLPIH